MDFKVVIKHVFFIINLNIINSIGSLQIIIVISKFLERHSKAQPPWHQFIHERCDESKAHLETIYSDHNFNAIKTFHKETIACQGECGIGRHLLPETMGIRCRLDKQQTARLLYIALHHRSASNRQP